MQPLGPLEFETIRAPEAAEVSDDEMARRVLSSAKSVRQVRQGTYPSRAFADWLASQGIAHNTVFDPNRQEALRAWAPQPPDWILALAEACDGTSQAKVAQRLRVSSAQVNLVLNAKYKGRYDRIAARVREELM